MSEQKKPTKRRLSFSEGDWSEWYKPKNHRNNNQKWITQRAMYEEIDQIMGSWYMDENKALHYKLDAMVGRTAHLLREKRMLEAHIETMQEVQDNMLERIRHERGRIQLFADLVLTMYETVPEARTYLEDLGILDIDREARTITIDETTYDLEEF